MDDNASAQREETDVDELCRAWVNEKIAPDILPHKEEVVRRLISAVQEQDTALGQARALARAEEATAASVQWMDVNRTWYVLRSYLRTRLAKIEAHVLHILNEPTLFGRLSDAEREYAKGYTHLLDGHFHRSVLAALPPRYDSMLQELEDVGPGGEASGAPFDMIPEPGLDGHIFCRVKEDIGNIEMDRTTLDLKKDELLVVRYKLIRALLDEGCVHLL